MTQVMLADNVKRSRLMSNGRYERVITGKEPLDSQEYFYAEAYKPKKTKAKIKAICPCQADRVYRSRFGYYYSTVVMLMSRYFDKTLFHFRQSLLDIFVRLNLTVK